jgi:SAM-dependent methyltransferase
MPACPLCTGYDHKSVGLRGGRSHHAGLGTERAVLMCRRCSCLFAHPHAPPDNNPYSDDADGYFALHDPEGKRQWGQRLADEAQALVGRAGSMLELGCGRGELLAGAHDRGWEVSGVDMTPEFVAEARSRGVDVEEAPIETCRALERTYDAVLLAAVLEHVFDPMLVLRRAASALKPGGVLFVDVPNERSLALRVGNLYQRLQGRQWCINLSPTFSPYHVVGFSPASLRFALTTTGFEVCRLDVVPYKNAVPRATGLKRRIERAAMGAAMRLGSWVGMGDGLVCWARKPA